jgi:hypothetical protein
LNFINNINIDISDSVSNIVSDDHFLSRNYQKYQGVALIISDLTLVLSVTGTPTYICLKNFSETEPIIVDSAQAMDHFPQRMGPLDEIFLLPDITDIWAKTVSGDPARLWVMVCGLFDTVARTEFAATHPRSTLSLSGALTLNKAFHLMLESGLSFSSPDVA